VSLTNTNQIQKGRNLESIASLVGILGGLTYPFDSD